MSNRVTVPVRVHPETRDEWHDFVDSHPEWDSVSDLIRGSVEREKDGLYTPQSAGDGQSVEVNMEPIIDHLKSIDDKVSSLDQQVQKVEHRASDDPISSLAMDIRDHIPTVSTVNAIKNIPESPQDPIEERISNYGRFEDIIEYYTDDDTNEYDVRKAMDRLRNDLPSSIQGVEYYDDIEDETMRLCEVK